MTVDDKKRNWEAYFVEVEANVHSGVKVVYGGKDTHNSDIVYAFDGEDINQVPLSVDAFSLKVYLGKLDGEDWYASDSRGREIVSLDHTDLNSKIVYFVRKL